MPAIISRYYVLMRSDYYYAGVCLSERNMQNCFGNNMEIEKLAEWYFTNYADNNCKTAQRSVKLPNEIWTLLLAKAISSFSRGIDDLEKQASEPDEEDIGVTQFGSGVYTTLQDNELIDVQYSIDDAKQKIEGWDDLKPGEKFEVYYGESSQDPQQELIAKYFVDEDGKLQQEFMHAYFAARIGKFGNAIDDITFLVIAQEQRRQIDVFGKASTIYTDAMSKLNDPEALQLAHKQLEDLSKTQGVDKAMAQEIAGLAADIQNKFNAATAYAKGQSIGQGGIGHSGLPTGLSVQGKRWSIFG